MTTQHTHESLMALAEKYAEGFAHEDFTNFKTAIAEVIRAKDDAEAKVTEQADEIKRLEAWHAEMADDRNALQARLNAIEGKQTWKPTDAAIAALRRFAETCEDGEGYDVPADTMHQLACIGLIRKVRGTIYQITDFGEHALNAPTAPESAGKVEACSAKCGDMRCLVYCMKHDLNAAQPPNEPAKPGYTTGHCEAKRGNNGVCPNHNLQCGWPDCDRRPA